MSVGRLRWTWRSRSSTACWSWDARITSAPLDPGRGRGQCARDPDPCNTVSRGSGPRAFTMQPKPEFKTATLIPSAQSILDALTVAVALLDRDGTIVAVNQGWRTFARDNGANCPDHFIASNYLEVCDHVPGVD